MLPTSHLSPHCKRRTQSPGVGIMLFGGLGIIYRVDTVLVPHPDLKPLCLWYVLAPQGQKKRGLRKAEGRETQAGHGPPSLAGMSRKGWRGWDKRRTCREPCVSYQGLHSRPLAQEEILLYSARLPVCPPCYKGQEKGEAFEGTNTYSQQGKKGSWQPLRKDPGYAWPSFQPEAANTLHVCQSKLRPSAAVTTDYTKLGREFNTHLFAPAPASAAKVLQSLGEPAAAPENKEY